MLPKARRPPPHPEGDRKGPIPTSTLPPPLQRHGATHRSLVVFVRAGVVWSRVGTLAVALGVGLGGRCLSWLTTLAPSQPSSSTDMETPAAAPRGALPFPLPPKNIRILGNFTCP